jgi:hypothetical protein
MLGLKGDGLGNPAGAPQGLVVLLEPALGQIEPPVQQGGSLPAGVAQEDPGLAVLLLARVPAPLGRDADRMGAVFRKL